MSSIKKKLVEMVAASQKVRNGNVIRTGEGSIFVSSPEGIKEFMVSDKSNLKVGDTVRFQGNVLIGKVQNRTDAVVHVV